ncbi:MAG: winged helix-turn-helix domain-containing protein, partial [Yaniella sp.]|nr:winged helix-turn-helix domain-containing protein [Yaniella sp.]
AHKRTHGYYVLPFLLGEHLVARVDLKHDRHRDALLVRSAFAEAPGPNEEVGATWPDRTTVLHELASELATMARWLGTSGVTVDENAHGDLAAELNAQIVALNAENIK